LKCCLRYEDQTYTELKKKLPRRNAVVKTPRGEGRVIDAQILTQLVIVEYEAGNREAIGVEDIEVIRRPEKPKKKQAEQAEPEQEQAEAVEAPEQLAEEENENSQEAEK
jgi:cell fate regulator YaaT (PSP1 superfamily)